MKKPRTIKVALSAWELAQLQIALGTKVNNLRKSRRHETSRIARLETLIGKIAARRREMERKHDSAVRASAPETDHLPNAEMGDPAGDTCPASQ